MTGEQRIVILGGPDRTGKTHIAQALASRLNVPYFKASSEHETYLGKSDRFLQQLLHADPRVLDFIKQTGCSVVMDRGYCCEFVYSSVFARTTDITMLRRIDEGFAALGAVIIVCKRISYQGIQDDIDPNIDEPILERIDRGYDRFISWTHCKTHTLYVDDHDLQRQVGDITHFLQERKQRG